MDECKSLTTLDCMLQGIPDSLVETYTQTAPTYVSTPIRVVYVPEKRPCRLKSRTISEYTDENSDEDRILEDDEDDDEKQQKVRQRHPERWLQNVRKNNKNRGLAYVKTNGELVAEKKIGPPCTCRMKCFETIGQTACEKVFKNFWKLGDHSLQNAYIAGCVRIALPAWSAKNKRSAEDASRSRRFFKRSFYVNVRGVDTEICKMAFLSLHCVSNGRLDRLLKKKQESGNTGADARGRHNNKTNKIPLEKIREVRRHIDGFRNRAGFTGKRKSKTVELLPAPLNMKTMYRAYRDEQIVNGKDPVCEFRYRKIFHEDFHIDFMRAPQKSLIQPIPAEETIEIFSKVETEPIFTMDDKAAFTTLEPPKEPTATYVTLTNPDFYSGSYTLQPQNWVFTDGS